MKKLFTLCASLFVGFATMNAQTFAFVDASDKVIENGSTLTMDGELEIDMVTGNVQQLLRNVSVKNISNSKAAFDLIYTINQIPGGEFKACCLGQCVVLKSVGESVSYIYGEGPEDTNTMTEAGGKVSLSPSEWVTGGEATKYTDAFGDYYDLPIVDYGNQGTCVVKVSVSAAGASTPDSEITINFVNDNGAGVSSVVADKENPVVGYYTIGGAQINAPQKGINIVKYADGTTKKIILK